MAQTGYTPISLYYSSTASAAPTAGNLVAGELAINTADGKLFYKDSAGVVQVIGTKGGVGSSSTTQVLYNSSGLVVGSANMTFSGTALTLANDASISGLTVGKGGGAVASNTVVGNTTLPSGTTGGNNVAVGYFTGAAMTSGANNTAIGQFALPANTTGSNNVAVGQAALAVNVVGANNIGIGVSALVNTTASNNTALGYQAGYSNTTGAEGVFIGGYAGYPNTTGASNTFVGYNSGRDSAGITGSSLTALGSASLYRNTSGNYNTAIGGQALLNNTTASNNTAVGYQAGYSNTTGAGNAFFGIQAGYSSTGSYNAFLGAYAGYNSTGSGNTFVGINSTTGNGAGYNMTTGSDNTILGGYNGNQSGLDIRTANNYIVLSDGDGNPRGYFDNNGQFNVKSSNSGYSINQENSSSTGLAYGATLNNDGTSYAYFTGYSSSASAIRIRIWSNGNIQNANNSYGSLSDIKIKENIVDATPKIDKLNQVRIVNYNIIGSETKQIGVIAQELEQIFPSLVEESRDYDKDGNDLGTTTKGVKYSVFVPILVKAIQELKAEVDSLKQQLGK